MSTSAEWTADSYPGQRLGLPAEGPGSVAGWGARLAALAIDWLLGTLVAFAIVRPSAGHGTISSQLDLWPVAIWAFSIWVLTATTGASFGQRLRRLRVAALDGEPVGLWRALIRTVLMAMVLPPLVADKDRRGLHDLAVGTVVIKTR